jgi:hypothetical protein
MARSSCVDTWCSGSQLRVPLLPQMHTALACKSISLGNLFSQRPPGKSGKLDVNGRADWDTADACAD